MKRILCYGVALMGLSACTINRTPQKSIKAEGVNRIISTLASDDMEGRGIFTPGIEKAADFIGQEFRSAGLSFFKGDSSYLQTFYMRKAKLTTLDVQVNGEEVSKANLIVSSSRPGMNWNDNPEINVVKIAGGEDFFGRYRELAGKTGDAIVIVDPIFSGEFARLQAHLMRDNFAFDQEKEKVSPSLVFVLGNHDVKSFRVNFAQGYEKLPLSNVVGVLPGKTKPNEYIVFSGHYDHLGIVAPVGQDSIANGADDDASGVTAVISLAKAYAKQGDNARTLIFVAFTAEESGGFGSQYFSKQLNPDSVVAMVNIEMIGKDSRFGPNTVYITGFERSDLGTLMQKRVEGTGFAFHPDPYPEQNLFYRSDNATLAAQGVPAHSFSTVQIDKDEYYHTVKDELGTLDLKNIISTIKAIALGARGLVSGEDTPTRIPKLQNMDR